MKITSAWKNPVVLLGFGIAFLAWAINVRAMTDPDFFWHVKAGEWILAHRAVPHVDLFSWWAAGHAWIAHEWASEVILALLYRLGGFVAPVLFFGGVIGCVFILIWKMIGLSRVAVPPVARAWLLMVVTFVGAPVFSARTQMFDILFTLVAVYGLVLYRERGDWRWLAVMPFVMVAWVNLHGGGVLLYPLVVGTFCVAAVIDRVLNPGRFAPRLWTPIILSTFATMAAISVNPNGPALYGYAFGTVFSAPQNQFIVEWQSPDFHAAPFLPYLAYVAALIGALSIVRVRDSLAVTLSGGFLMLSLFSARHTGLFAVLSVSLLGPWCYLAFRTVRDRIRPAAPVVAASPSSAEQTMGRATFLVVFVLVVAWLGFAIAPATQARALETDYPVGAADYLVGHPFQGRLFNVYEWGGYLAWRLDVKVGLYGAADVLGDKMLTEGVDVLDLRTDPRPLLNGEHVTTVVVRPTTPLAIWLSTSGWHKVYGDSVAVVFER